ncbi:MAG: GlsB/YeaQ/YmgE family stress response membrane protein [Ktedonobacterales bacterium]
MGILAWIVLGGLAGWLASVLVRGTGLGILADILIGIVGAFIGGFIVSALGGTGVTGFNLWSFVVAVIGAVVLLLIVRLLTGGRSRSRSRSAV